MSAVVRIGNKFEKKATPSNLAQLALDITSGMGCFLFVLFTETEIIDVEKIRVVISFRGVPLTCWTFLVEEVKEVFNLKWIIFKWFKLNLVFQPIAKTHEGLCEISITKLENLCRGEVVLNLSYLGSEYRLVNLRFLFSENSE